ncbi:MAG: putative ABC transporter permease [Clostridia bacterium]|nr:putative ABC transporter permease [Clostridia bacterium]
MEKDKKKFTIAGYSFDRIIAYFTIYSVAGFVIETIFGAVTKGVIESRQSFVYGPFCAIYGVGALAMILLLRYCKKNFKSLFIGGFIVGSIVEYIVSLIGELIFHVKWWDYSDMPLNINGRVCVYFSIFWGFLAVCFLQYIHPHIEKLIDKIQQKFSEKFLKGIIVFLFIFQLIDLFLTGFALEMFIIRKVHEHDLNVAGKAFMEVRYNRYCENKTLSKMINQFFNDRKMIRTFPNLKIQDVNGAIIYFDTLVGDIQPYYYKFHFRQKKEERTDYVQEMLDDLHNEIKKE